MYKHYELQMETLSKIYTGLKRAPREVSFKIVIKKIYPQKKEISKKPTGSLGLERTQWAVQKYCWYCLFHGINK